MAQSDEIARSIRMANLQGAAQSAFLAQTAMELFTMRVGCLLCEDNDLPTDAELEKIAQACRRAATAFVREMSKPAP